MKKPNGREWLQPAAAKLFGILVSYMQSQCDLDSARDPPAGS